jgi:hypothetical protein
MGAFRSLKAICARIVTFGFQEERFLAENWLNSPKIVSITLTPGGVAISPTR